MKTLYLFLLPMRQGIVINIGGEKKSAVGLFPLR